ncbi:MAG: RHS repeat-associated core domain-containing protein [Bdellovibrionaceae bacterium]|nr:RHS repeat-associated core domain-containing protein [Pseudobdellovibrionaceae bacterium]
MISRTDGAGNVTAMGYTPLGKVKTLNFIPPSGTRTLYNQFYDADQLLTGVTKGTAFNATPSSFALERVFAFSFGRVSARIPTAHPNGTINSGGRFEFGAKAHVPDLMYDENGIAHRIISDYLGSPRMLISIQDGVVRGRSDYDEFGRLLSFPGMDLPFGFAGGIVYSKPGVSFRASQQQSLLGFGARVYDPEIGRWISKDPILFGGGDTNLYGYVMNDPVNFIDPKGLFGVQIGAGGSIGALIPGGSAYSGIAITYSGSNGFQFGFYGTNTVTGGYGAAGGLGFNFSISPSAQNLGDLSGGAATAGVGSLISPSASTSTNSCGKTINSYGVGVGIGTGLYPYVGGSSTWVVPVWQ